MINFEFACFGQGITRFYAVLIDFRLKTLFFIVNHIDIIDENRIYGIESLTKDLVISAV
jgi:hypothetical protein